MKVLSTHSIRIVATLALLGAGFVLPQQEKAYAEERIHFETTEDFFSFTVTVVDVNGKVLSGKKVALRDITDGGNPKLLPEKVTNEKGQAVFESLPLNRNFNVVVDGIHQGYTVRTGVKGSHLAASFTAPGTGTIDPIFSEKPAIITVSDEEGEPLSNQEVVLHTREGREVGRIVTGPDGVASFVGNLMDGTMYTYTVNGRITGHIMPGNSLSVYIDTSSTSTVPPVTSPSSTSTQKRSDEGTFTFVVTILGKNGKVLEGKSVALKDITDETAIDLGNQLTNADGQAIFKELPISRNISVSVDGESKGHTIRAGKAKTVKAASFFADGIGTKDPIYTDIPLTITVRDEEGEPLANQEVSLTNSLGQPVASIVTGEDGKAVFDDRLMEGMFYEFSVNGIKMYAVTPGNDISAYLKAEDIRTSNSASLPTSSTSDTTGSSTVSSTLAQNGSSSSSTPNEPKGTSLPLESQTALSAESHSSKKVLPSTGSKEHTVITLLGIVMALLSLWLLRKERVKKS